MNQVKEICQVLKETKKILKSLLVKKWGRRFYRNHKLSNAICSSLIFVSADPSTIWNGILNLVLESCDKQIFYFYVIIFILVFFAEVYSWLLNMFDFIFKLLLDFSFPDIGWQIVFVQENDVVAIIFLIVLADEHFINKHGSIRNGLFVWAINDMDY